jgi:hypothetical protein
VIVHYFSCVNGAANWWATEFDPKTGDFFGYAELFQGCGELGYFNLNEFEESNRNYRRNGHPIPPVERDLHFKPGSKTLQQVMDGSLTSAVA